MNIEILAVGKTGRDFVSEGVEMYLDRLKRYAPVSFREISDIKKKGAMTADRQKEEEGKKILSAVEPGALLFLLDEHGKSLTSKKFASFIQNRMNSGVKKVYFAIGGAYGFSREVYRRADGELSLSAMTFPHDLIRIFLVEQIYRAFTILKGEPYHHE